MPPEQYGIYGHAMAIGSLAAILAAFGTETFLMREIGVAGGRSMASSQRSQLMRFSITLIFTAWLATGLVVMLIMAVSTNAGAGNLDSHGIVWLVVLIAILALFGAFKGAAKGDRRFVLAQFFDGVLRPILFLSLILYFWWAQYPLSAERVIAAFGASALAVFILMAAISRYPLGFGFGALKTERVWFKSCLSLVFVAAVMVMNRKLDLLMLGFMVSESGTGAYLLATRLADFLSVAFSALSISYAARISRWVKEGRAKELQFALRTGTRWAFILTAIGVSAFWYMGAHLLEWFNPQYLQAEFAFRTLMTSQLINMAFGLTGLILVLTHDENWYSLLLVCSGVLNVFLNWWLIPKLGISGAALATCIVTVIWNAAAWYRIKKQLGIDTSIMGRRMVNA